MLQEKRVLLCVSVGLLSLCLASAARDLAQAAPAALPGATPPEEIDGKVAVLTGELLKHQAPTTFSLFTLDSFQMLHSQHKYLDRSMLVFASPIYLRGRPTL